MPSIAIVGAGPAGLTLARLLLVAQEQHKSDLKISIFEHDASAKARFNQGGTLDLHPNTGIAALKAAKMWDDILPHMRYDGEELVFADMNATKLIHMKSDPDPNASRDYERPEVDREVLKDYLLKAVQELAGEDAVTWGKHLIEVDGENKILRFRDGTEAGPFDLIVGADGAWSKVRNLLSPDVKPSYSGICGFESHIDQEHAGDLWNGFTQFVGKGSFFSYSNSKSLMAQRMENGSMKVSVWSTREATWPSDLVQRCGGDEEKIRQALLEEFSDWDEQQKALLTASFQFREWILNELPVGFSWEHQEGFTLIGDSAHLMTPFAGEGVNAAMKDCLELAKAITSALTGQVTLDEAVRTFELEMFPRSNEVQGKTAFNKQMMFRKDAPVGFLSRAAEMYAVEMGYDPTKGLLSWIVLPVRALAYTYFWSVSRYGYLRRCIRRT